MIILADMDNTIEDLTTAWCDYLNKKHGTNVKSEDIIGWEMHKFFPTLTQEEVYEPLHCEDLWLNVKPYEDAMIYLKKLQGEGHSIYIVTTSNVDAVRYKYEYVIKRYFPYIKWKNMIFASKKQMISGDVLIDDGIHNLEGGSWKKILMTAPHNLSYSAESNGMIRANDWSEVYKTIQSL